MSAWERAAGGSGLSAAQVEHFFERGYVCCRQVLPQSKRRRLEAALTEHLDAECARLLAAGELSEAQLFAEQPFERRIGMVAEAIEDSDVRLRLMTIMQAIGLLNINPSRLALGDLTELADALLGCIRHEELLACAESLLGADILSRLPKLPGAGDPPQPTLALLQVQQTVSQTVWCKIRFAHA